MVDGAGIATVQDGSHACQQQAQLALDRSQIYGVRALWTSGLIPDQGREAKVPNVSSCFWCRWKAQESGLGAERCHLPEQQTQGRSLVNEQNQDYMSCSAREVKMLSALLRNGRSSFMLARLGPRSCCLYGGRSTPYRKVCDYWPTPQQDLVAAPGPQYSLRGHNRQRDYP